MSSQIIAHIYGAKRYAVKLTRTQEGWWGYEIGRYGEMGCGSCGTDKGKAWAAALSAAARLQHQLNARYDSMIAEAAKAWPDDEAPAG